MPAAARPPLPPPARHAGFGAWLLVVALWLAGTSVQAADEAWLLSIDGAIGPATADYVIRNLEHAAEQQAALVILQIDTPGGLDKSTRSMIQGILDSPVPVACLVAPAGARAASAGTYILYACHIAAMAPASHLGAATPVSIGAPGMPEPGPKPGGKSPDGEQPAPADAMTEKVVNDAAAYLRTLAQLRGRNAEWAEEAVRRAATLTAREALAKQVIDLIADDPADLLRQLDGRKVALNPHAPPMTLRTAALTVRPVAPDWRTQLLAVITDPNIAYILMLIGIYGLLLEFYHPGALLPGVTGGICLLLALYAFQLLPISYIGFGLIVLGLGLMLAEALMPSIGVLGVGGAAAFVIGSIMLMDTEVPGFRVALALILAFTAISAALVILVIGMAIRARRAPPVTGQATWIGKTAEAAGDFEREGMVHIQGELWQAVSPQPVRRGQRLTVTAIDGLVLQVQPAADLGGNPP